MNKEKKAEIVATAVRLYAEYIRQVAKNEGRLRVSNYFESDMMDDMLCGGNRTISRKADEASRMLDAQDYGKEHSLCDQYGCGDGCPRAQILGEIQDRLVAQFGVPWMIALPQTMHEAGA